MTCLTSKVTWVLSFWDPGGHCVLDPYLGGGSPPQTEPHYCLPHHLPRDLRSLILCQGPSIGILELLAWHSMLCHLLSWLLNQGPWVGVSFQISGLSLRWASSALLSDARLLRLSHCLGRCSQAWPSSSRMPPWDPEWIPYHCRGIFLLLASRTAGLASLVCPYPCTRRRRRRGQQPLWGLQS